MRAMHGLLEEANRRRQPWRDVLLGCLPCLLCLACDDVTRPDGGEGLLEVGAIAPDFEARDAEGKRLRFATTGGSRVVYFYPKDGTPGCTTEACAFRDTFNLYAQAGATIFGVSGDSVESHARFREEHRLPFPLASDEDGEIARGYGVPTRIGMPSRVTFIVDASGKVARVFPDVDPGVHADEVLRAVP